MLKTNGVSKCATSAGTFTGVGERALEERVVRGVHLAVRTRPHELREPVRAGDELAVRAGGEHRDVKQVRVGRG